jgi:uncharacterized membrane protein YfcA
MIMQRVCGALRLRSAPSKVRAVIQGAGIGISETILLFCGGLLAGIINVIVGGAGFMTFPLLMAAGMTEIEANASNFVAVLPANLVGTFVYRKELKSVQKHLGLRLFMAAFGGLIGSLILTLTGQASFQSAVPWLLLFATTTFAVGPRLKAKIETYPQFDRSQWVWLQLTLEFCVYVYSGYFGLGMGIILFAIYGIFSQMTLHQGNAVRNITTSLSSLVAIAIFIHSGLIRWVPSLIMMSGAVVGGFIAVHIAKRLPAAWVRMAILAWAVALTGLAFYRCL